MSNLNEILNLTETISKSSELLVRKVLEISVVENIDNGIDNAIFGLAIFVLSTFIGYIITAKSSSTNRNFNPTHNLNIATILIALIIIIGSLDKFDNIANLLIISIISLSLIITVDLFLYHKISKSSQK